ncbi:MAG: antibiotic biosynthesis monooxygenase [Candidatus Dadabacteria bacterium]|nr:antibiotic biosynthesis monooxygenase [Candidatus Dadabacteria bacterium]
MLTVIAHIKVKEGKQEDFKRELFALIPRTLEEEGCLKFELLEDEEDGTRFFLYENWTGQSALDFHYSQHYTKKVFESYEEILSEPVKVWHLRSLLN